MFQNGLHNILNNTEFNHAYIQDEISVRFAEEGLEQGLLGLGID